MQFFDWIAAPRFSRQSRWFLVSLLWYYQVCWFVYVQFTGHWLYDPDIRCKHAPAGNNQTGIKVLVGAISKSGTRAMMRSLYHLGYSHSYHSEDALLFVWSRIVDDFWNQPHKRGQFRPFQSQKHDRFILGEWYKTKQFTDAFSRCRVDAMSFDGIVRMFNPIYDVSPGAKVIILQWRTYEEQRRSFKTFFSHLRLFWRFHNYVIGYPGMHIWVYMLLCILDPLFGNPIIKLLEEGGPPVNQIMTPITLLYYIHISPYRVSMHTGPGALGWAPSNEWRFDWFYDLVRAQVPAKDRFEFDYRRHKFEDLCTFLKIDPCPMEGPLPKHWSGAPLQADFPRAYLVWLPLCVWCHWFNWRLFVGLPRAVWRHVGPHVMRRLTESFVGRKAESLVARLPDLVPAAFASLEQQAEEFDFFTFLASLCTWVTWPVRTLLWLVILPFRLLFRLVRWAIRTLLAWIWWVVVTPFRILKWLILAPFRLFAFLIHIPLGLFDMMRSKLEADSKDKVA